MKKHSKENKEKSCKIASGKEQSVHTTRDCSRLSKAYFGQKLVILDWQIFLALYQKDFLV